MLSVGEGFSVRPTCCAYLAQTRPEYAHFVMMCRTVSSDDPHRTYIFGLDHPLFSRLFQLRIASQINLSKREALVPLGPNIFVKGQLSLFGETQSTVYDTELYQKNQRSFKFSKKQDAELIGSRIVELSFSSPHKFVEFLTETSKEMPPEKLVQ